MCIHNFWLCHVYKGVFVVCVSYVWNDDEYLVCVGVKVLLQCCFVYENKNNLDSMHVIDSALVKIGNTMQICNTYMYGRAKLTTKHHSSIGYTFPCHAPCPLESRVRTPSCSFGGFYFPLSIYACSFYLYV